jgi:hypothetical protein
MRQFSRWYEMRLSIRRAVQASPTTSLRYAVLLRYLLDSVTVPLSLSLRGLSLFFLLELF